MPKLTVGMVLLTIFANTSGAAQEVYPSRPITMIVPFPASGPSDVVARIVAERMRISLGQPVVVENVTGAGGTIALTRVVQSAPDGYTLVIGNWATHVGAAASFRVSYDIMKDFEPVALLAIAPLWLVGTSLIPATDLKGLIAWLKAAPGQALAGTAGPGSLAHLSCVYFQNRTGTHFQLVPYRGGGQAVQDLVAGNIHLQCGVDASSTLSLVRSGDVENDISCTYAMLGGRSVGVHVSDDDAPTTFAGHGVSRCQREAQRRSAFAVATARLALSQIFIRHLSHGQ
jgi:tripartite-type tricarboxylate transporter receptor subunit TctC